LATAQQAAVLAAPPAAVPPAVPDGQAVQLPSKGSTTAELIAGMQARFSEAQQLLLSLQLR
jgi:hypothetical protein